MIANSRRRELGFTLIEFMTVVGIIIAIAVPGLLRAPMSGSEASAIGSLRAISSGQSAFAASCGSGFFAPTLQLLGTPPAAGEAAYIGTDLNTDPPFKSTYQMTLVPGPPAPRPLATAPPPGRLPRPTSSARRHPTPVFDSSARIRPA